MFNKKRKAIILFFLLVGITRAISAQELNDSVYTKFKKCLYGFLEKEQKGKKDSLLIFFKPESILFGKSYQSGGVIYSVQTKSLDSANSKEEYTIGNKCFIDSHKSFDFFLNSFITTDAKSRPEIVPIKGRLAFIYIPGEDWQQFYLDRLIGYDSLFVFPTIDILEFSLGQLFHKRYRLNCCYKDNNDFFILHIETIRSRKIRLKK